MNVDSMDARFDFDGASVKLSSPLQEYMKRCYWPCPKNMIQLDGRPISDDYTSRANLCVWFQIRDMSVIDMGNEAEFKEIVVTSSQSALEELCDRPDLLHFNAIFNDVWLYKTSKGYSLNLSAHLFSLVDGG